MEDASSSNGSGGGIDWSIFRDGEEDAFGWLLRSSAPLHEASDGAGDADDGDEELVALADFRFDEQQHVVAVASTVAVPPAVPAVLIKQEAVSGLAARHRKSGGAGGAGGHSFGRHDEYGEIGNNDDGEADDYDDEEEDDDEDAAHSSQRAPAETAARKRSLKRKASASMSEPDGGGGGESEQDKKQLRRVKNLASVREFRKRKMKQMEQNEHRLRRLEAENLDLKMRLKIGKEAIVSEQREKQQIKEQMREMLQRNASEQEIARFLNMYKVTYSDYGPKRREKLRFHLERIRELLLPTQVTKLCLYSVEQGVDMLARDHVIKEDPMSVPDSSAAPMSLWGILASELDVSDAQQRQILERRTAIKKVQEDLNHTLRILQQLEGVTEMKNTALESQVAELQQILTPSQATKFIIWVKENPAFMYMLDKLVDKTLRNTEDT
ncbi:hypothetical protein PybrP1_007467 [[Pythium] brassicae (nom. inval.)]|nr:hypothetical protein PybrP1_007467 [[Pythium] brassicae (nom. inval.)]